MTLSKLETDLNHVQTLVNQPKTADGFTPTKIKEIFDQAPNEIKEYLNNVLTAEIEQLFATKGDLQSVIESEVGFLVPSRDEFDAHEVENASQSTRGHISFSDMPGLWQKINDLSIDQEVATIDIDVPVDLDEIRIICTDIKGTQATNSSLEVTFNNIKSNDYGFKYLTGNSVSQQNGFKNITLYYLLLASNSTAAGQASFYVNLTGKTPSLTGDYITNDALSIMGYCVGYLNVVTKINTINLTANPGFIGAGSKFEVWGR